MTNSIAPYYANIALNCLCRGTSISALPSMYLAAYSGDPRSSGVELTASNGYARIAIPTYGSAASGNNIANTTIATWPTATGSWTSPWDTIVFVDASSGTANQYWIGALLTARTIVNTNVPTDQVGALGLGFTTSMGTTFGNGLLNVLTRGATLSPPTTPVLAPYNGNPLSGGTELTTNGASRIAIPTFGTAASGGAIANTTSVNWGAATGNWTAQCTYLAFVDNTGGALWAAWPVVVGETIITGDVPTVPIGGLQLSFN